MKRGVSARRFCGEGWNLPAEECSGGHPMTPAEAEVFRLREENEDLRTRLRFHAIRIDTQPSFSGAVWIVCHECGASWVRGEHQDHKRGCMASPETSQDG